VVLAKYYENEKMDDDTSTHGRDDTYTYNLVGKLGGKRVLREPSQMGE
jgi:hypothetical protein